MIANTRRISTERPPPATKFLMPELPGRHVPRPHPHAALDAAAQLPLTVVVVRGAGKSVVLESWLRDRPGWRPAWLSCNARDADPVISGWR